MLCSGLEYQHVVESTTNTKSEHTIRERSLTEGIDEEDSKQKAYRKAGIRQHRSKDAYPDDRRVPIHDPCNRRHRSGSGRLPTGKDHRCTSPPSSEGIFPDGIEVKSNVVGGRNNCTRDDVVTVEK